jgi:enolase-phosphatase E1
MTPRAIVTDIEGTTSSIAFVHEVLFPYSRARLADYVAHHADALESELKEVRAEAADAALDTAGCVDLLLEWHDADRKIGPLKAIQGLIWADGYAQGLLKGHVYPDAAAGLKRWHDQGIALYIYSSGSVAAQKLIFGCSDHGDLTPLLSGHFDTAVGGKREVASYQAIASAVDLAPEEILFLSDVEEELAAAREAGFAVTLLARDHLPATTRFPVAQSFDSIVPREVRA